MKLIFLFFCVFITGGINLKTSKNQKFDINSLGELSWQQVERTEYTSILDLNRKNENPPISRKNSDLFDFQAVSQNNETSSNFTNSSIFSENSNSTGNFLINASNSTKNLGGSNNDSKIINDINSTNRTNTTNSSENQIQTNFSSSINNTLSNMNKASNAILVNSSLNSNITNNTTFTNNNSNASNSSNFTKTLNLTNFTTNYTNMTNLTNNNSNLTKSLNFSSLLINNSSNSSNFTNNSTSPQNNTNKTDNSSIFQNPNPSSNMSKLENITEKVVNIINPPKNVLSEYKTYLSDLNYSSNVSNVSVKKIRSSISLPRTETLKSLIRGSLIVDSLNEKNKLRKHLENVDNVEELIRDIDNYNNCSNYSNCSSCVGDSGCGWCPTLNLCIIGNNEGPYLGRCPLYQFGMCADSGCARYTDCDSCLKDLQCGWCQNEERNFARCVLGSEFFDGCPSDFWFHSRRTLDRLNSCHIDYGPSEDQLERREQNRLWEKNQVTRMEKLRRRGREIREGLGVIPNRRQSGDYLKRGEEYKRRLEKVEEMINSFSVRKNVKLE